MCHGFNNYNNFTINTVFFLPYNSFVICLICYFVSDLNKINDSINALKFFNHNNNV